MKRIGLSLLIGLFIVGNAWATATSETGDTRAVPASLYGQTSGGVVTAIHFGS
jgi:hypothetical protein